VWGVWSSPTMDDCRNNSTMLITGLGEWRVSPVNEV
jgi:hypothetical protein